MKPVNPISLFGALLLAACASPSLAAPDEEALGKALGYPIGTAMQFSDEGVRVGLFSNAEKLFPHNTLGKADSPSPLKKVKVEPEFRYSFNGLSYSVDDYLQHQRITGLLIVKDSEVQVERYQYDRMPTHRFISHSMAKSITSFAVAFALDEGKIKSLDDKMAKYVPELAGYPYGETSIRNILRMASGVKFIEDYSGNDDLSRFFKIRREKSLVAAAQSFGEREAKEGTRFHYATSESDLLEATDWHKQPDAFAPGKATPVFGYGYQFWILPDEKRRFALLGIYGQMIYVDPELKLVMVQTAVAKNASVRKESMAAESYGLWSGLVQKYQP